MRSPSLERSSAVGHMSFLAFLGRGALYAASHRFSVLHNSALKNFNDYLIKFLKILSKSLPFFPNL